MYWDTTGSETTLWMSTISAFCFGRMLIWNRILAISQLSRCHLLHFQPVWITAPNYLWLEDHARICYFQPPSWCELSYTYSCASKISRIDKPFLKDHLLEDFLYGVVFQLVYRISISDVLRHNQRLWTLLCTHCICEDSKLPHSIELPEEVWQQLRPSVWRRWKATWTFAASSDLAEHQHGPWVAYQHKRCMTISKVMKNRHGHPLLSYLQNSPIRWPPQAMVRDHNYLCSNSAGLVEPWGTPFRKIVALKPPVLWISIQLNGSTWSHHSIGFSVVT